MTNIGYIIEKGYGFISYGILLHIYIYIYLYSTCLFVTCWIYFGTFNFSTMTSQK